MHASDSLDDEIGDEDEDLYLPAKNSGSIRNQEKKKELGNQTAKVEDKDVTHLFVFAGGNKAGMDNTHLDAEKQMAIIHDASKDSAYMNQAESLDSKTDTRVQRILARLSDVTQAEMKKVTAESSRRVQEMEASRSFSRHMCVLDMDSFYASVEIRDRPELAELPVAVGIGMICTSNYVARKFGVRSGMPGFIAMKLCPQLVCLPLSFGKYTAVAEQVRDIVRKIDPNFSSHSLDEVIFDVTDAAQQRYRALRANQHSLKSHVNSVCSDYNHAMLTQGHEHEHTHTDTEDKSDISVISEEEAAQREEDMIRSLAESVVAEMRCEIKRVTGGLTASAGIAQNTPLAKICSNINKPDGQYSLTPMTREHVLEFCAGLSTRQVGGVGKVGEKILSNIGIKTMGDALKRMPHIMHAFSLATSRFLLSSALGICEGEGQVRKRQNLPDSAVTRRSLGAERTMSALCGRTAICQAMLQIIEKLAAEMQSEGLFARTVTLKLKNSRFEVITRSSTGNVYIQSSADIGKAALALLEPQLEPGLKIRLIGVRCSTFKNAVVRKEIVGVQPLEKYLHTPLVTSSAWASESSSSVVTHAVASASSSSLEVFAANEKVHLALAVGLRELGSRESASEEEGEGEGEVQRGEALGVQYQDQEDGQASIPRHGQATESKLNDKVAGVLFAVAASAVASPDHRKRHKGRTESNTHTIRRDSVSPSASASTRSLSTCRGTDHLIRKQTVKCPVCEAVVKGSLHHINVHVDACLSRAGNFTIRQFFEKINT